jgi:hypothetical protein
MKQSCNNNKKPKERKLQKQPDNNDFISRMEQLERARCLDTAAAALREEANHIPRDEGFCQPALADERVLLAVHEQDDAAQDYVDGGCEEGGGYEEEE